MPNILSTVLLDCHKKMFGKPNIPAKFQQIWQRGLGGKVVDARTHGRTIDDGRWSITK
jgi:hypothetical protein